MKYIRCGNCALFNTNDCPVQKQYTAVLTEENGCTSGIEKREEKTDV